MPAERPTHVTIPALPQSMEAFLALRDELAGTPEGGAVIAVVALNLYAADPESPLGHGALVVAADRSRLTADAGGYKGWNLTVRDRQHLVRQIAARPWTPRSYISGTAPATGYALPEPPYAVELSRNPHVDSTQTGRVKVFVACTGAASPRHVTLQRNNRGLWKAVEWSSLTVGVVPPAVVDDDDL